MSVDWFAVLDLPFDADIQAVNSAWRRLVLLHHPDKLRDAKIHSREVDIRLINEARAVLSNPQRRAEYLDSRDSTPQSQPRAEATGPTIHQHISLSDFTPQIDEDGDPVAYTHPCRCSGTFTVTYEQLEEGVEVIGCPGCGQWCRVGYAVDEDEDDGPEAAKPEGGGPRT